MVHLTSGQPRWIPRALPLMVLLLLLLPACERSRSLVVMNGGAPALRPLTAGEATGDLAYREPFPAYATASTQGRGRVFLVAVGSDLANFAQEVADQRAVWRARGFSDDQIVCYYAKPPRDDYRADRQQFDALRDELPTFYAASPALVGQHLREAADTAPDTIYLYVTGHGGKPWSFGEKPSELASDEMVYLLGRRPELDDHVLATGATRTGTANLIMKLHAAEHGHDPTDLFLTPAVLRDWLLAFPAETRKVVVLQGCYSGGFLQRDPDYASSSSVTLADVPNLVAISAARHDRPSFGCSPGEERTFFGGVWLNVLKEAASDDELDWPTLYEATWDAVNELEKKRDISIAYRSRPVLLVTDR